MSRRSVVALGICGAALLATIGIALAHLSTARVLEDTAEASSTFEDEADEKAKAAARTRPAPGAAQVGARRWRREWRGARQRAGREVLRARVPGEDIPLANLQAARAASARLKGKAFPSGRGRTGTWISVGPSHALYPATDLRNSSGYVPARYMAGGRATAVAIDPNCRQGHCRIWIFAAGGGVWRAEERAVRPAELGVPVG